jgi:hypothetical protein
LKSKSSAREDIDVLKREVFKMYHDAMDSAMERDRSDESWKIYTDSLHGSLERLETIVNDIEDMREVCKDEWCEVTDCLLGEATVAAFAITEPHWSTQEDSKKIKELKKRIHDLHASNKRVTH